MQANSVISHSMFYPFYLHLDPVESLVKIVLDLLETNPVRSNFTLNLLITPTIPFVEGKYCNNFVHFGPVRVHACVVVVNF